MNLSRFLFGTGCVFAAIGLAAAAGAATGHQVFQKAKNFSAKELSVSVGDTVSFVNDDSVKHNILIRSLDANSGVQAPGQSFDVAIDQQGSFKVRCGIHPKMKMTIVAQ